MLTQAVPSLELTTVTGQKADLAPVSEGVHLRPIGMTYSMAQCAAWVDPDTFAIGRWDGTLTLFGLAASAGEGPRIESAAVSPTCYGVQMVAALDDSRFVTSCDAESILLYTRDGDMNSANQIPYDRSYGTADSATVIETLCGPRLATGHENGQLLIWTLEGAECVLDQVLDLRSPSPVPSPFGLRNIRATVAWRNGMVLTGSEDGDLCLVDVAAARIVDRLRYNPSAQRGINDVAVSGDWVVAANCSAGRKDRNCWTFRLEEPGSIRSVGSANLVEDPSKEQVFNFAVELVSYGESTLFACATGEGLLWVGNLTDDGPQVGSHVKVSSGLGAAITYGSRSNVLAVIGDNVHLYELTEQT